MPANSECLQFIPTHWPFNFNPIDAFSRSRSLALSNRTDLSSRPHPLHPVLLFISLQNMISIEPFDGPIGSVRSVMVERASLRSASDSELKSVTFCTWRYAPPPVQLIPFNISPIMLTVMNFILSENVPVKVVHQHTNTSCGQKETCAQNANTKPQTPN